MTSQARSIIVVEDECIVAMDLQQTLHSLGYDAFAVAASGEEAIARAAERCPDLVLMDIRIQGAADGIETAEILRRDFNVPIIYLTAHADEATIARAKRTEPHGYLLKPVKTPELQCAIEVCLYKHEMENRLRERERWSATTLESIAEDRLASLGTMAAGVAHEINKPLAVVIANAEFVAEQLNQQRAELAAANLSPSVERGQDAMIRAAADLQQAASRIRRVIGDLRAFTRPATQPAGTMNVLQCVHWALRTTAQELDGRAQLVAHLNEVPAVRADEVRLGQVLIQLLVNAAQAIEPGHPNRNTVSVTTRAESTGHVVIEVADTGCGIAPETLPRIFDPFFTTKAPGVGAGLGLAICRGIMTSLGGELMVESQLGMGTRFSARLPAAPVREPASFARLSTQPKRVKRSKLLAVDDEELVLRVFERVFRAHDLRCVRSAGEALALIDGGARFDLILSDLMMPGMDGRQFYEALLGRHPNLAQRIVFVSGAALTAEADDFLRTVANPRIDKPFDVASLLALVEPLLAEPDAPHA